MTSLRCPPRLGGELLMREACKKICTSPKPRVLKEARVSYRARRRNQKLPVLSARIKPVFLLSSYYHANELVLSRTRSCVNTCHLHVCLPRCLCVWDRSNVLCLGTTRPSGSPRNRLSGCIRAWSPARPSRCVRVRVHEADAVTNAALLTAVSSGDGAPVRAGAAAGLHSEKQRGRGGGPHGPTDPQRSPRLQSRKRRRS